MGIFGKLFGAGGKKGRKYSRNRIGRSAGALTRYRSRGQREINKARRAATRARHFAKAAARRAKRETADA